MPLVAKRALNRGEIDPLGHARSDKDIFILGLAKARNGFVHKLGGFSNRAGTYYRAPVRYHTKATRLIPFKFGETDTHWLEFGDGYMRVLREGVHVFDVTKNISAITQASPAVFTTSTNHGFATGDEIEAQDVGGMVEFEGRRMTVTVLSPTTFSVTDQLTGTAIDSTAFTAFTSGGTVSRVYTVASPYAEADLFKIKYMQEYDVVTLACAGYTLRELQRSGLTSWAFVEVEYESSHPSPASPSVAVNSAGSETYRYAVTAVSEETGEESLPSIDSATSYSISGITQANPAVVTFGAAPGLETGHEVELSGISGMTELNGKRVRLAKLTTTTYQLQSVDSTLFSAYTSGGVAKPAFVIASSAASTPNNTISWAAVAGSVEYNVYRETDGVFGFLAATTTDSFTDTGAVSPNTEETAPFFRDPFFGEGNYPLAVGRFQQRNVYAGTENAPSKVEFSRIRARKSLSASNPIKADDAFAVTLDTTELGILRHVVTGRDLMLFTNTSVHVMDSGSDSGFGFSTARQKQQADVGASDVRPLVVDKQVLFDEDGGTRVNSIAYRFSIDGYDPEDLTLAANHFFLNDRIVDWAYVPWPEPIVYAVTEAGYCLAFTYAPQEDVQVKAWCRFETDGFYRSVAAIREKTDDRRVAVAFVVERDGKQFIEVQNDRNFTEVEDCYFVDCGNTFEDAKTLESVAGSTYTITGHGWVNGDSIAVPGGLYFTVASATTNTFELTGSTPSNYAAGSVFRKRLRNLTGLHHLAGKTVVALVDGNVERAISVDANGLCTLPYSSARTHIGRGYTTTVHTLPVGNVQVEYGGRLKKMDVIQLDLLDSRGFHMGVVGKTLDPWKQREFEAYGQPTTLFTGFVEVNVESSWTREGKLAIEQRDPLPLTIRAIVPNVLVG